MPTGDKYLELTTYLERTAKDEIKMSFTEIESVLGFTLGKSTYTHPALWSNSESHSIAFGWLNAGYESGQLDIKNQTIVFTKVGSVKERTTLIATKSKKTVEMAADVAVKHIRDYFQETINDEHGRYLSWRHCYNTFQENRNKTDEDVLDYLSLHLAFYLASWGMYRGSSFLLQKDYKVHIPIIQILQEQKYNPLCGISALDLMKDSNLDLLEDLSVRIRKTYADAKPSFEGFANNATDTLVTKILLGTLGCVPAYDRYYVQAVIHNGISSGQYNKDSVRAVAKYYMENETVFEELRKELSTCGTEYPVMKLMDMCMWQAAFIEDTKKQKE